MFNVEKYLLISNEKVTDDYLLEKCGNYAKDLEGYYVILPKSNINNLLKFVETELQNPTYVFNLLGKNPIKGMDLLANMLKINSYTDEFIKHYGGIQEILDLFKPASATTEVPHVDFKLPENDSVEEQSVTESDNVDMQTTDFREVIPESENLAEESNISSVSETSNDKENSYNKETEEECKVPAIAPTQEMMEMMLMIRGIAAKLGITEDTSSDVMNPDDILHAKLYINDFAAPTVRDGVIAVLDKAETKEELVAVTTFMRMFVQHIKEV